LFFFLYLIILERDKELENGAQLDISWLFGYLEEVRGGRSRLTHQGNFVWLKVRVYRILDSL
jgi:hypothetical protein